MKDTDNLQLTLLNIGMEDGIGRASVLKPGDIKIK